jgi:FtsP/CotA-like multicopper oxidase with cupredoxin domain
MTPHVASSAFATQRELVAVDLTAAETSWEFAPGRAVHGFGFNGRVPGPVIEAFAGSPVRVQVTNHLPEPTVVHWHGLRVPSAMDGTDDVQRPIAPGESFTYTFTPPDAGTFWYHSHYNETEQIEKGLYGALIVRGTDEPVLDAERVLVFDDLDVDRKGRLAGFGGIIQRHNGRQGSVRLVNGVAEPTLAMAAGQVERWRIVNASSARYIRLSIGGQPFRVLGTSGGLLESPVTRNEWLLPAADRVDLAVGPFVEGQTIAIRSLPYNRRAGIARNERFATVAVGPAQPSRAVLPDRLRTIEPLVTGPVTPTRTVKFGVSPSLRRGLDFTVNHERHHHGDPVTVGSLQIWDLVNTSMMDHPFHLHGFFFQVIEVNGQAPAFRSWEDVVNLPPRSTVRIAWMPDDRPGRWMYHCHILEHHAAGMMAHFEVVRPGEQPTGAPPHHMHHGSAAHHGH